ncbi:hypothetical protein [Enterococcus faecium]|uniref:hypothetical protein n=1 Tax=Enterococcus faecium TaxID=1352 RepID=UPI00387DC14D
MRNKFHKLLSMFLVMLIVINQFGNITVLAESLAEQPERSLTIEVDQEEAVLWVSSSSCESEEHQTC